jgi:DNA topoisomerase-1
VPDGGTALQVLEGRFGPYVTDGEVNASIPKGADPATISLEDAQALLEARRGAPPREPRRSRRAAASGSSRGRGRRAAKPAAMVAATPAPVAKAKAKAKNKPKLKPAAAKRAVGKRAS